MSLIAFKLLKSRNGATPFLELHHTLHKLLPYDPVAKESGYYFFFLPIDKPTIIAYNNI